jgi:hypothetical protein
VLPPEFSLLGPISSGDVFNIIVAVPSRLLGLVLCDPIGGSDGQAGVVPGGVGAVGAVRGGVRGVVSVSGVFIVGDGEQVVSVRSAESLA